MLCFTTDYFVGVVLLLINNVYSPKSIKQLHFNNTMSVL